MIAAEKKASIGKDERIPPRERILTVAADLFYRHGIRAVGVEAIAEAAGTNKMTLYRQFASKDLLVAESTAVTVESIQKLVANHFNLKVAELKSKNNSHQISFPRQVAMYLCKRMTESSLPEIGRRFGGKHHSTVIHAIQKIERKRSDEKDFDRLVETFVQLLH